MSTQALPVLALVLTLSLSLETSNASPSSEVSNGLLRREIPLKEGETNPASLALDFIAGRRVLMKVWNPRGMGHATQKNGAKHLSGSSATPPPMDMDGCSTCPNPTDPASDFDDPCEYWDGKCVDHCSLPYNDGSVCDMITGATCRNGKCMLQCEGAKNFVPCSGEGCEPSVCACFKNSCVMRAQIPRRKRK